MDESANFKKRCRKRKVDESLIVSVHDQVHAAIYGHCIGSAVGLLTRGLSRDEASKHYSHVCKHMDYIHKKIVDDGHRARWDVGDWTEKTDQMMAIIQSLIDNKGSLVYSDIVDRMRLHSDTVNSRCVSISNGSVDRKDHKLDSTLNTLGSNNNVVVTCSERNVEVVRAPILGIHSFGSLSSVMKDTLSLCRVTSTDPRCQASCVAVAVAVCIMLQRYPRIMKKNSQYDCDKIAEECLGYASKCLLGTKYETKELCRYLFPSSLKDLRLDETNGQSGCMYKPVGAAFWALRQKNFRSTLQTLAMEGGDADSNCALAGCLLACKLGSDSLPSIWIDNLRQRLFLDSVVKEYLHVIKASHKTNEAVT